VSRDEDGFLSRWSRRKQEARRAPPGEAPPAADPSPPPGDEAVAEGPAQAPAPDPDAITEEELAALPPVESIGPDTDIAGFLRKGVPAALRKAALRRVWAADPMIRDYVNEAREYAYDWNTPGGVPGFGSIEPGEVKAMLARVFGETPQPRPDAAPQDGPAAEAGPPGEPAQVQAQAPDATPQEGAPAPEPPPQAPDAPETAPDEAPSPRPRRHGGAVPV
jgi:hypothetical protein